MDSNSRDVGRDQDRDGLVLRRGEGRQRDDQSVLDPVPELAVRRKALQHPIGRADIEVSRMIGGCPGLLVMGGDSCV